MSFIVPFQPNCVGYVLQLQDGMSSMIFAAQGGHTETVALLLDRGAEVNATSIVSFAEYVLKKLI